MRLSGPLDLHSLSHPLPLQVDGSELEILQHLHDSVYQQTQDWYQRLASRLREQIDRQYGVMPDKEENIQVRQHFSVHFFKPLCLFGGPSRQHVIWFSPRRLKKFFSSVYKPRLP